MLAISISKGNTKLGNVPNVNLPPGPQGTCRKDVPCYGTTCYAKKAWRQYPNVREAWTRNWTVWRENPEQYETQITDYLSKHKPPRFRWHAAGDIPSQEYFAMMCRVANAYPDTAFLVYTKRYEFDLEHDCANLSVIYSRWPGLPFPDKLAHKAQAHYEDEDSTTAGTSSPTQCPGSCVSCSLCWKLASRNGSVLFRKH